MQGMPTAPCHLPKHPPSSGLSHHHRHVSNRHRHYRHHQHHRRHRHSFRRELAQLGIQAQRSLRSARDPFIFFPCRGWRTRLGGVSGDDGHVDDDDGDDVDNDVDDNVDNDVDDDVVDDVVDVA